MPSTSLSTNANINALLGTYQWGTQNGQSASVSYSFPTSDAIWIAGYTEPAAGWFELTANQQISFKNAVSSWAEIANIEFTQVIENKNSVGDIRVTFSNQVAQENVAGWAYSPVSKLAPQAGDIWLNPEHTDFSPGLRTYFTIIHELGHALGLKHPFEEVEGNTTVLTEAEDNSQYTLMSYNEYNGAGFVYQSLGGGQFSVFPVPPTTPILYDIAAIQFLYGANMTTRAGNDTYTFSNTQGELKTIWDAGGIDTFDLSNQTLAQTINLNAGKFSSLGVKQISVDGTLNAATANIAIAYNVDIENAIGSSGNDTILGNAINNVLKGGAGNDTINGGLGNDKLLGGTGTDNLNGNEGNDTYIIDSSQDSITELVNAGIDTVESYVSLILSPNVEKLMLLKGPINGTGNDLDNIIFGSSVKNTLNGGLGNDKLIGGAGADVLIGGTGNDLFLFNNLSAIDTISDFSVKFDTFQLENAVFTSLTRTGILSAGQFIFGSSAADFNDFLIYNQSNGALYYDADGNGAIPETQIAKLGINLALTNGDFIVA